MSDQQKPPKTASFQVAADDPAVVRDGPSYIQRVKESQITPECKLVVLPRM